MPFDSITLEMDPKNYCCNLCQRVCPAYVFLRNFRVISPIFNSLIHFDFIFVLENVLFNPFPCSCPVSLHCIFLNFLLHRLINHKCMDLLLGFLCCSIDLCVYFGACTILFWLLYFGSIVSSWEHDSFLAQFFLKTVLLLGFFLYFHTNFKKSFV